ncbi:glucan biosynthesis protein, partial [Mycobacterium tuberculosis]|nr:glucan biosynthesis protein [Mycobacterium tuberculosis]
SGFRLRRQINTPDRWDEVVLFQGATYFKALAKGLQYGVSARGLAINLSEEGNEEFPTFERFYVARPKPGGNSIVVHALLER